MVQISLSDNLNDTKYIDVRLRNRPQDAGGAAVAQGNPRAPRQGGLPASAAPGEAAPPQGRLKITVAPEHDDDKEYLDNMRGWLMTVATLFVTMTFQAVLQPPDWFNTEWYTAALFPKKHGKAGSPVAAPPPSPHTADATRGELERAYLYFFSNIFVFGTALALVLVLLWETPSPRRTVTAARIAMPGLSFFLAITLALGTSDNWAITAIVFLFVVLNFVAALSTAQPYPQDLSRTSPSLILSSSPSSSPRRRRPIPSPGPLSPPPPDPLPTPSPRSASVATVPRPSPWSLPPPPSLPRPSHCSAAPIPIPSGGSRARAPGWSGDAQGKRRARASGALYLLRSQRSGLLSLFNRTAAPTNASASTPTSLSEIQAALLSTHRSGAGNATEDGLDLDLLHCGGFGRFAHLPALPGRRRRRGQQLPRVRAVATEPKPSTSSSSRSKPRSRNDLSNT
ncbi:hypothetical protein BAE44_0000484, partial [Dichanthelium oligosanthes]